ncbi:hypothetical protein KH5_09140 [Urechidicola sp. KH5]
MALTTFIIPSDKDVLRDINEEPKSIKFIGTGTFSQSLESIKFYRTFVNRFDKSNKKKHAIYYRKGLIWRFLEVSENLERVS